MASIVGVNFDFTYNGILSDVVNKKPSLGTPGLQNLFTILPGIGYQIKLPTLDPENKVQKPYASCGRTFASGNNIQNTELVVRKFESNNEWCKDDFEQSITTGNHLAERWLKSGIDSFNPDGTEIKNIIVDQIADALRRDIFRRMSFGDTASGSDDYDTIDGMITKLVAGVDEYCVKRTSTPLGISALSSGAALNALKEAYEESSNILKQTPKAMKTFYVTGSVYENLLSSYESNTTGSEAMFLNLTKGQGDSESDISYRGIPVMPIYAWDDALADADCPLNGTTSHLVVYTTKKNHFMGVHMAKDLNRVEGWYERKDRKYYFESFMVYGYNYVHCDLQTIAY